MNELRNPSSMLAGANIVFTTGSFLFLYKRIEQLQNDNTELKNKLNKLTENMAKNNQADDQRHEFIGKIFKDVKHLKEEKASDLHAEELRAIIEALEEQNISVTLPKKKNKKKKYVSSEESSEEETPKKKYKKKTKDEIENEDIINLMRSKQRNY